MFLSCFGVGTGLFARSYVADMTLFFPGSAFGIEAYFYFKSCSICRSASSELPSPSSHSNSSSMYSCSSFTSSFWAAGWPNLLQSPPPWIDCLRMSLSALEAPLRNCSISTSTSSSTSKCSSSYSFSSSCFFGEGSCCFAPHFLLAGGGRGASKGFL